MEDERSIMNKILSAGVPVSEWSAATRCGIAVSRIKTFAADGTSEDGKYVCAVLNSMLGRWFALNAPQRPCAQTSGASGPESMPIPQIAYEERQQYVALSDQISAAKAANPNADTSALEEGIDWLVFELYDLTDEETSIVSDAFWEGELSEEEEDAALARAMEEELRRWEREGSDEVKRLLRGWDAVPN